jgi:PAS domain S-box-containing protein
VPGRSGSASDLPPTDHTQSQAFTRLVTDYLPQVIRVTDHAGRALYLNAQWSRFTGQSVATSLGFGWQQALHPDDRPTFTAAWQRGAATAADFVIEYRLRRADGVYRWFESHAVPAEQEADQGPIWLSSLTDIDDRKRAERERDALFGAVAHDLRSPLTTLIGRTQLLQRRLARLTDPAAPALAAELNQLVATGQHMAAMVAELTDLERVSRGAALDLDRAPLDLVALVREAATEAAQAYPDRVLRVDVRTPRAVGAGDATRVRRVIANLLGNAAKYSAPPTPIRLTLQCETRAGQPWAVLAVEDEGIGIPAADLPHVFERFYRAGNAVGQAPGTGIGLAGVQQIVEQHQGSVSIASTEGQGTTVTLALPLLPHEE